MVGDGFRVHNFFPSWQFGKQRMSPFFMLDYNSKFEFPPTDKPRGVDVHPHRGFETVTIAYHGRIAHHDSAGNSGIISPGDVQWMTAGSGVLHKEYHEETYSKAGGPFQMVQLWVNLPASDKMHSPRYQELINANMGRHELPDTGGIVEVIAGSFGDAQGPAMTFSPMHVYNLRLEKGGKVNLDLPENFNTAMLVIEGDVDINSQKVRQDQFVLFENKGTEISVSANEKSIVLVLSGQPLNEPIAAYGPFLMNTMAEIQQAMADFHSGKFGYLN
jgi:redox-sensitive bicupin YhaK (pirin superfamily)